MESITHNLRPEGECALCGKKVDHHGACSTHTEMFEAVIENALELAATAGLTEDESVGFVSSHIARVLKREAEKYAKPGEFFTPGSFQVKAVKCPPENVDPK